MKSAEGSNKYNLFYGTKSLALDNYQNMNRKEQVVEEIDEVGILHNSTRNRSYSDPTKIGVSHHWVIFFPLLIFKVCEIFIA